MSSFEIGKHYSFCEDAKDQIELKEIAKEVFELLKTKKLPAYQFEEVLTYAKGLLTYVVIK